MAAFYTDEGVSLRLAPLLIRAGHTALTAQDLGHRGLNDAEQLAVACQLDRILITENRDDFVLVHNAWHTFASLWNLTPSPEHPGILIVPQRPTPQVLAHVLQLIEEGLPARNHCYAYVPRLAQWVPQ